MLLNAAELFGPTYSCFQATSSWISRYAICGARVCNGSGDKPHSGNAEAKSQSCTLVSRRFVASDAQSALSLGMFVRVVPMDESDFNASLLVGRIGAHRLATTSCHCLALFNWARLKILFHYSFSFEH